MFCCWDLKRLIEVDSCSRLAELLDAASRAWYEGAGPVSRAA